MFGLNELLTGGNDFHVWQDTFTLFLFYSSIGILIGIISLKIKKIKRKPGISLVTNFTLAIFIVLTLVGYISCHSEKSYRRDMFKASQLFDQGEYLEAYYIYDQYADTDKSEINVNKRKCVEALAKGGYYYDKNE